MPGPETTKYAYDENNRLTKGGSIAYKYNAADNVKEIGSSTYSYDEADELKEGAGVKYSYDELDERTERKPASGPATMYGYDQAGNLISVKRPEEGSIPKIEDTYAYDGNGLRVSQTTSGATSYLTWDMVESLPLVLSDGSSTYIYGPRNTPVEQISNEVSYLHVDQQGSVRMLTNVFGAIGSVTYDAYGNVIGGEGFATTSLGYDGQYTNSDTGLIYLRARSYDPATAQFLSPDPIATLTRMSYSYALDNPLNVYDATGLCAGFGPGLECAHSCLPLQERSKHSGFKGKN